MNKYTIEQILAAWEAVYGEDMTQEYPGFIQELSRKNVSSESGQNERKKGE